MIDHETHLKQVFEAQRELGREITDLSNLIASKKEQYAKYQGIAEYLTANGVKVPEDPSSDLSESTDSPQPSNEINP